MPKYRIARVLRKDTGKPTFVQITLDGRLYKKDQKRTGLTSAPEWVEITADSWNDAQRKYVDGHGEPVTEEDLEEAEKQPTKMRPGLQGKPSERRVCALCYKNGWSPEMRGHIRHAHELEPGDYFRFEGRAETFRVREGHWAARKNTSFTLATGGKPRWVSGTTHVVPVDPLPAAPDPDNS